MKSFYGWLINFGGKPVAPWGGKTVASVLVLAACFCACHHAGAQVIPSADRGGFTLSAGGAGSGFYLQYGERKMLGISAFADADTHRGIGVEAEGNWMVFNQTANVHASTYAIGPRYHLNFGRVQPFATAKIGIGEFNFPYNLATGSYLIYTFSGGGDYRLNRKFHIRIEAEDQLWPQFTYGSMASLAVKAGLRYTIR